MLWPDRLGGTIEGNPDNDPDGPDGPDDERGGTVGGVEEGTGGGVEEGTGGEGDAVGGGGGKDDIAAALVRSGTNSSRGEIEDLDPLERRACFDRGVCGAAVTKLEREMEEDEVDDDDEGEGEGEA